MLTLFKTKLVGRKHSCVKINAAPLEKNTFGANRGVWRKQKSAFE